MENKTLDARVKGYGKILLYFSAYAMSATYQRIYGTR